MRKTLTFGTALVMVLTVFTAFSVTVGAAELHVPGDYPTIQSAIENASAGDTIIVAAGTYIEEGQILIDKDLAIEGVNKATTIIKPADDTGSSGDARGWFLVDTDVTFHLSDITLDGTGKKVFQGIRWKGDGSVTNCDFNHIQYDASVSYAGLALVPFGGDVDITGCTFTDIGRVGVLYFGSGITASTYSGNTYIGKGDGDWLDYGVELGGGAQATVTDSLISDCTGVASVDGSTSAGMLVTTYWGSGTEGIINNNILYDNTCAIAVGYGSGDSSTIDISGNIISGNEWGIDAHTSSSGNTLSDNIISDTGETGIFLWNLTMSTVTGNVVVNSGEADITIKECDYIDVSDNVVSGCEKAVNITDSDDVDVEGNVISEATYGIWVGGDSDGTTIASNTIADNTEGIRLNNTGTDTTISFNVVDGNSDYGIRIESTDVVNINTNSISDTTYGIWLDSSDSISITSNIVSLFTKRGISALDSGTVNVKGNTVAGDGAGIPGSGENRHWGIYYRRSKGTISENVVEAIYHPGQYGAQSGVGIQIYEGSDVDVLNNHVSDYQKGGIVSNSAPIDTGDPVLIKGNTVIGWGWNGSIAQNGIQVGFSSDADVINNYVEGNWWTGGYWTSCGILLYDHADDILVDLNTVVDSQTGIADIDSNSDDITRNSITNSSWGILIQTTTGLTVSSNFVSDGTPSPNFSDQDVVGIYIYDDTNSVIKNNIIDGFYNGTFIDICTATALNSNIIKYNIHGVVVSGSSDVDVEKNSITDNDDAGVLSLGGNSGLTISKNTVRENGKGIILEDDETAEFNVVSDNVEEGILVNGNGNSVFRNTVRNNNDGIKVAGSGNTISRNVANNNNNIGIWVTGDYNMITRNIAMGNGVQDAKDDGTGNVWIRNVFGSGP
jgi:parallel beta-helix repeat protein